MYKKIYRTAMGEYKLKNTILKSERPDKVIVLKKTFAFRLNRALTGLINFFYRKGLDYQALTPEESLQMLLKTGKSYIRFGNGESEILVGLDMFTQVYSKDLKESLIKIIKDYSPDCRYVLGLTNWCLIQSVRNLKATPRKKAYKIWRFMRYMFWKLDMNKINMPFLEADMFRVGNVGLGLEKIELLWAEASHIIMVYNSENHFQRFRKRYRDKKIYFIKIPDKNFFDVLLPTQNRIIDLIKDKNINRNDLAILVSAGPGANVLCYNLCQKGNNFLCYDVGNLFYMHFQEVDTMQKKNGNDTDSAMSHIK